MTNYCTECLPKHAAQKSHLMDTLREMIKDWEEGLGEHDKSLYSLGLRRSLDIIQETLKG